MAGSKAYIIDQFVRKLTVEGKREKAENNLKKALEIIARSRAAATNGSQRVRNHESDSAETECEASTQKKLLSRWFRITAAGYNQLPMSPDVKTKSTEVAALTQPESSRVSTEGSGTEVVSHSLASVSIWDPLLTAIEIAKPQTNVIATRIAGTAYRVPVALKEKSARSYAIRWIIANAKKRSETSMAIRLANEIEEINGRSSSAGQNATLKQRDDLHKIAEANRAFINYMK
jgi:ribosomal protein S7